MTSGRPRPGRESGRPRLRATLEHHAFSGVASLGRLLSDPVGSALTAAVIAIALALPAGLHLLLDNARKVSDEWRSAGEVTVFLDGTAGREVADRIAEVLRARPEVTTVELVAPEVALAQLARRGEFGEALGALDANPLPWAVIATPRTGVQEGTIEALAEAVEGEPGVAFAQFDMVWLIRFNSMLEAGSRLVHLIAGLLALGVLLIVGNTIRLDIENRREEIEIIKMLGGTDGFVRRPFLYAGAWLGLAGGALAMLLLALARSLLAGPIRALATAYEADFGLSGPTPVEATALLGFAGAAGWLGSWIAVSRHLARIEPGAP